MPDTNVPSVKYGTNVCVSTNVYRACAIVNVRASKEKCMLNDRIKNNHINTSSSSSSERWTISDLVKLDNNIPTSCVGT